MPVSGMGALAEEAEWIDPNSVPGSITPRLFPEPLVTGAPGPCGCGCALTPDTTYGFAVELFAEHVLGMPLDPWERWLVIHAGELLLDGRPRFKKILLIVARQNGKTQTLMILVLFWLFVERWALIIGQSTTLAMAGELWQAAQDVAEDHPVLGPEFGYVRKDNNNPHWKTTGGARYKPAAATRKGPRGGAVDRLMIDELREQLTWEAYRAAMPTLNARPYGQAWLVSNMGDAKSIVLLELRKTGIANIEAQEAGDPPIDEELGLFEWSAPKGSSPTDIYALAAANPNMNHPGRVRGASLLADGRAAADSGDTERLTGFLTEIMCMYVPSLDSAVDPAGWALGAEPGTLDGFRGRLALVPELSPDGLHASISVAAMVDHDRVRVEVVASWSGQQAATQLRRSLAGWVRKIKPRKLGWLKGGPVEAIAAELTGPANVAKLGQGVQVEAIRGEASAVCMGFAEMAGAGDVLHDPSQTLLDKQVLGSAKLWRGAVWVFSRKGEGHCDTAYGTAAAAWLARTMPPPVKSVGGLVVVK